MRAESSGATPHTSPLVERGSELRALDSLLARAACGTGGVLVFEARPGLGKSRLLAVAQANAGARGWHALAASGIGTEQMFPFGVVLQLFESLVRARSEQDRCRMFGGAAGLVRPLLDGSATDPSTGSMFAQLHGLHWLVSNIAETAPVLLVVDDVQWCDEPSLAFLQYLARRITALPVAMVLATRPPEAGAPANGVAGLHGLASVVTLRPQPLSTDAVRQVVGQWWDTTPDDGFVAACARVTAGNPLYLRELLIALDDVGARCDADAVPVVDRLQIASVARAVFFRASALGASAVELLRVVAVFGGRGSLRQVAQLVGLPLPDAGRIVDALVTLDLLASGDHVAFTHPLVQAAIYADMPRTRRGEIHGRIAELLAAESAPAGLVAAHLLSAPAAGSADTVRQLREAARSARVRGAEHEAIEFLTRALAEPPPAELRWAVLTELGAAETAAGRDATEHLRAAVECAGNGVQAAQARQLLGRSLQQRRMSIEAVGQYEQALEDAGNADPELTASLHADLIAAGLFEPATRERVRSTVPAAPEPGEPANLAQRRLLANLALRHAQDAGPAERTFELVSRAWGDGHWLTQAGVDGRTWLICLWALLLAERYELADALAEQAIDQAAASGSMLAHATACHFRGQIRFRLGRLQDALADLDTCIAKAREGWAEYLFAALATKAEVLTEMGRLDAAADALREAEATCRPGVVIEEGSLLDATARLALARGCAEQAFDAACRLGHVLENQLKATCSIMPWRALGSSAAIQLGRTDDARTWLCREQQVAERIGARASLGRAFRIRAHLEPDDAQALLERAVEVLEDSGATLELATALVDLGATFRRRSQRTRARGPLRRAVDLAHACGAAPLAERANAELLAAGAARRQPGARGVDALTPSERRVAELAAQGVTSREIAQSLFVTTKTVEFHLGNTYHKLGIRSRRELQQLLADPPGTDTGPGRRAS